MTTVNREFIRDAIDSTKGRIFSVTFIKSDGSIRKMVCRTGVVKHLSGGQSTTKHKQHLRTVWDIQNKGYRAVNMDTLLSMKAFGQTFSLREYK